MPVLTFTYSPMPWEQTHMHISNRSCVFLDLISEYSMSGFCVEYISVCVHISARLMVFSTSIRQDIKYKSYPALLQLFRFVGCS